MAFTHDCRVQHSTSGVERVDSRVDTQFSQGSRQDSGCIQECESGCWRRVSQVIGRDVYCLYRGDGSLGSRADSFLQRTQVSSKGWLVTDSRWDTSQQCRHFGTCLSESEYIVDEEENILVLFISELLSNGQTGQTDSSSCSWWLVHLSVDQCAT